MRSQKEIEKKENLVGQRLEYLANYGRKGNKEFKKLDVIREVLQWVLEPNMPWIGSEETKE